MMYDELGVMIFYTAPLHSISTFSDHSPLSFRYAPILPFFSVMFFTQRTAFFEDVRCINLEALVVKMQGQ